MINLLIIEDNTIKAILQDPRLVSLLPCLTQPKADLESVAKGGLNCTKCEYQKKQIAIKAFAAAKSCIRTTRGNRLKELKRILNAKQLRLIVTNANGKRMKLTF